MTGHSRFLQFHFKASTFQQVQQSNSNRKLRWRGLTRTWKAISNMNSLPSSRIMSQTVGQELVLAGGTKWGPRVARAGQM